MADRKPSAISQQPTTDDMKIKNIFAIATVGLMMAACGGSGQQNEAVKEAAAEENAKADSLMYCFGQMRGAEYLREAEKDSTFATEQAQKEFISGVQAGLRAVRANHDAYNRGVMLGIQMATNIGQFEKDYGVKLPSASFIKGIREMIATDSVSNPDEMQAEFYRLKGDFQRAKEERDEQAAEAALTTAAKEKNYTAVTKGLFMVKESTDSTHLKVGDRVQLDAKLTSLDGKELKWPFPTQYKIGQRKDFILNDALVSVASGQTGRFMTSAQALFGQRASQLGLNPADVVLMELTPTLMPEEEKPALQSKLPAKAKKKR